MPKSSVEDKNSLKNIMSRLKPRKGEVYQDRLRRANLIREKNTNQ